MNKKDKEKLIKAKERLNNREYTKINDENKNEYFEFIYSELSKGKEEIKNAMNAK